MMAEHGCRHGHITRKRTLRIDVLVQLRSLSGQIFGQEMSFDNLSCVHVLN